tara:strand:- start:75 stop:857 length:783 start_codon:yes stop_codon:yes gene_type:complete
MTNSIENNPGFFKKIINKFFSFFGYKIIRNNNFMERYNEFIAEITESEKENIEKFERICLASKLNLWSILQSLKYIQKNEIIGDIVECGVYNGNTLSFIVNFLNNNNLERKIWGYDTFEDGFLKIHESEFDIDFKSKKKIDLSDDKTQYYTLAQVTENIRNNNKIDLNSLKLIKGDVIKTLDNVNNLPEKISFLRMDTDIYKTTKKQLEVLYPRLTKGGILHIDDYGLCPGVKKAVDEYFFNENIWLHRVDLTCRYLIKN